MKKALTAALVLLATLASPAAVAAAAAAPPEALTIETARVGPTGTFEASGAFADSGTFGVQDPVFGGPGPGAFVNVHATETFTGTGGTFTMVRTVRVTWGDDPATRTVTGTWVVVAGTGAYEDLHARGTIEGTVTGAPPAEAFELTYRGTAVDG